MRVLVSLGHKDWVFLLVPESFVLLVTWDYSLFGVVLFPVFYFFCFTQADVICSLVLTEGTQRFYNNIITISLKVYIVF